MAEKQNSSDTKISTAAARQRANLQTLSRIIKMQTTSFQKRANNTKAAKVPARGGIKTFLMKVIVGTGAIYLSAILGIWGEPEESLKIAQKVKQLIRSVENQKILSEDYRSDLLAKFNETGTYFKAQIETIPEELKKYYVKTEKSVNDFIKSKKP